MIEKLGLLCTSIPWIPPLDRVAVPRGMSPCAPPRSRSGGREGRDGRDGSDGIYEGFPPVGPLDGSDSNDGVFDGMGRGGHGPQYSEGSVRFDRELVLLERGGDGVVLRLPVGYELALTT